MNYIFQLFNWNNNHHIKIYENLLPYLIHLNLVKMFPNLMVNKDEQKDK